MGTPSSNWAALAPTIRKKNKIDNKNNNSNNKNGINRISKNNGKTPIKHSTNDAQTVQSNVSTTLQDILATYKSPPCIAIDCEMVGSGPIGSCSQLARVSIVDEKGNILLDSYVAMPKGVKVTDYRTHVSGILPRHIRDAPALDDVITTVRKMLKGKLVIGHALQNDWNVLQINPHKANVRDTAFYRPLRPTDRQNNSPSLKNLTQDRLKLHIQRGEHDSVEDARAAMALYQSVRSDWEKDIRRSFGIRH